MGRITNRGYLNRWVKAALADGWVRQEYTGLFSGKKPKGRSDWPKEVYWLVKDHFKALCWFGPTSEVSTMTLYYRNGNRAKWWDIENYFKYDIAKIKFYADRCSWCIETHKPEKGEALVARMLQWVCNPCAEWIDNL